MKVYSILRTDSFCASGYSAECELVDVYSSKEDALKRLHSLVNVEVLDLKLPSETGQKDDPDDSWSGEEWDYYDNGMTWEWECEDPYDGPKSITIEIIEKEVQI